MNSIKPVRQVNTHLWLKMLADQEHTTLCEEILLSLDALGRSTFAPVDNESQKKINLFVNLFLFILTYPAFTIPDNFGEEFIKRNHLISNLVNLSAFKNTDAQLEIIRGQPQNYLKILTLHSPQNSVQFDRAALFGINPRLASMWYMQCAEYFHAGLVDPRVYANLREHYMSPSPQLLPVFNLQEPYFGSSYIDAPCERTMKKAINLAVQRAFPSPPERARNGKKIAVATRFWWNVHSSYRICAALIQALKPHYHLTFIRLGNAQHDISEFDDVIAINSEKGIPDPTPLLQNDFQMILYPDIGMTSESIVLANMRLAPIQACMLGHSVSTFGAEIDYFFSGARVETPDSPEDNYSERLVLLPGMGAIHVPPEYQPRGIPRRSDRIVINCPWHTHKINHELLQTLQKLIKVCTRPVIFRIFIGDGTSFYNDYPAFHAAIRDHVGEGNFELVTDMPYVHYMAQIEQGHLSLDAWHFGGCNTVSDSLFLRIPMLCREGLRWYNRIGPHMLRAAGLPELVAQSEEAYIEIARRLIHDDAWRNELTARLQVTDLSRTIYTNSDAPHFVAAVGYLMENHGQLKRAGQKSPLYM